MSTATVRLPVLEQLLADQREGTAVERFSRRHDQGQLPSSERYRALLPLEQPGPGQQYAFEVDLDACTGCKACVSGCHSLNGLDAGELWRTVGLLSGGSAARPLLQTVTSSCHHCLEPACLAGCPVEAYEKHPVTGIVKHLDDQCIGCQYCILMCPYDAPKYNAARGIVRKCDLCSERLAHGEPPACAQACPNQAIRVTVVEQRDAVEAAQAGAFLPGAPGPEDTLPTTSYRTRRELPRNLLPADFYRVDPAGAHPALVLMLVFTQLSVGAFAVELWRGASRPPSWMSLAVALGLALFALGASTLHLGRPRYAYRALLGLRTSWLSREILTFGAFAGLAAAYALSLGLRALEPLQPWLLRGVVAAGLCGVGSSVMVYEATRRAAWRAHRTGLKFLGTTAVLGCATVYALALAGGDRAPELAHALALAAGLKLGAELLVLRHLRARQTTALKRSALLLVGELRPLALARLAAGALGGIALPLLATTLAGPTPAPASASAPAVALAVALFALTLAGELCERHLFFVTCTALKMPGGAA